MQSNLENLLLRWHQPDGERHWRRGRDVWAGNRCKLPDWHGSIEAGDERFLNGNVLMHVSFVLSSASLRLFSWYSWFCEALSASGFLFLAMLLVQTSWDISTAFFSFSLMLSLRASSTQTFSFSLHFILASFSGVLFSLASFSPWSCLFFLL